MLSSTIAGLAGVLLAPEYTEVNGTIYQILIVAAIASAAVGRFVNIPMTLVGALLIGIGARALPDIVGGSNIADDLQPTFPFLVLFVLLVFWPKLRESAAVTDPLAGVDPPPPAMAHEYKDEQLRRTSRIAFPVFVVGFLVVMVTLVSSIWVDRITYAFVLAVIFLSITIFTGLGGQISLAQATFASVGAFTIANLFRDSDVPVLVGLIIGAVLAGVVGAVFVLLIDALPAWIGRLRGRPPTRLSGLYLSLATLAFALMADKTIFRREEIIGGFSGIETPRPDALQGEHVWFLFVFAVFAVVGLRGDPDPQGHHRSVPRRAARQRPRGGVGRHQRDAPAHRAVRVLGRGRRARGRSPDDAVRERDARGDALDPRDRVGRPRGDSRVAHRRRCVERRARLRDLRVAARRARVPAGVRGRVLRPRRDHLRAPPRRRGRVPDPQEHPRDRSASGRSTNARARLRAEGRLPAGYRPVWHVALPIILGPALYFVYILVRSPIQGHWVAVHGPTLLVFIVPSLLFGLFWIFRTDFELRREGGVRSGLWMLVAGAAVGAVIGLVLQRPGMAAAR